MPPTAALERTLGLAFGNAGVVTEVPCLEWEVNIALPGVGGNSLRSLVVTDKSLGRVVDEDKFFRACSILGGSSPIVEFDRT